MAEEVSLVGEIAKVLPYVLSAIVGGGLTVVGGIVGQLLTHRLSSRRESNNYRRDKLVQLMELLDADAHWLDEYRMAMCFRTGDGPAGPEPWDKASTISTLFFHLGDAEIEFIKARHGYKKAISEIRKRRIADVTTGKYANLESALPEPSLLDAATSAYGDYLTTKAKMTLAVGELGKKLVPYT